MTKPKPYLTGKEFDTLMIILIVSVVIAAIGWGYIILHQIGVIV